MLSQRLSERTQDSLFGFGAGVMLAACAFSLILPGLEAVRTQQLFGGGGLGGGRRHRLGHPAGRRRAHAHGPTAAP